MAILAMSPMGILPMAYCFCRSFYDTTTITATVKTRRTGVMLMGRMPMPRYLSALNAIVDI
jgi:hypothetical protein